MSILEKITRDLAQKPYRRQDDFVLAKTKIASRYGSVAPRNSDIIRTYLRLLQHKKIHPNKTLKLFLRKRSIRTLSGVAPVTVITKPYPCPGKCIYCPTVSKMPKSYLPNEPAIMRAVRVKFDPYRQVQGRLKVLQDNGHATEKVELIILGGTWSAYPKRYQKWFVKRCFDACNAKTSKTLAAAQTRNETAQNRIIGISIETRPEYITEAELKHLRQLGCTRVEIGVQSIFDDVLKLNQRGHTVAQTITATRRLKQGGFKVHYHLMPNLPGSTLARDLAMFKKIFSRPNFQPDILKIYPCVVVRDAKLYQWWKQGKYRPYTDAQLKRLIISIKKIVPPYVRLTRLVRDIPAESIVAGNKLTNLRQIIAQDFTGCRCIRCREAGHQLENKELRIKNKGPVPRSLRYRASNGTEYFLSFESRDGKVLYAFLRLRLNDAADRNFISELMNAALIRELHTYGELTPLHQKGKVQHTGLGRKLMRRAELLCRRHGIKKIAVISGIGVRPYYKKLGYHLEGTYMVKNI